MTSRRRCWTPARSARSPTTPSTASAASGSGCPASRRATRPARLNGELMRGFGLAYDGDESFATDRRRRCSAASRSAARSRSARPATATRWLDTFANTTGRTITVDVTFGGTAGLNTGNNQSQIIGHLAAATRRSAPTTPGSRSPTRPTAGGRARAGRRAVVHRLARPGTAQLPARPVRRAAARRRAGGQLLRLQEHDHARARADEVAAALRRRGPRRDHRDRRRADHRGHRPAPRRLSTDAGPRPASPPALRLHGRQLGAAATTPRPAPPPAAPAVTPQPATKLAVRPRATTSSTSRSRSSAPTWSPA